MTEPELWAARDECGYLFLHEAEPWFEDDGCSDGNFFSNGDKLSVDDSWLPSLAPGEKCRVRIVMDKE